MYAQHDPGRADAREFDDLYARYRARLVRYCRRRLGEVGDAEDAAHEALLRAFQAWDRFDPTADAWPWLATIAARVCADVRRRSARIATGGAAANAGDVHDLAVTRMRASIVDDALGRLPARYRNALILKEYAGWTYRDIAELEGTTVSSVRSSIMRSRRRLGARVESVARARGQWPLPAAVPGVAGRLKARVRSWRDALARLTDPAVVLTGIAFVMQPATSAAAAAAVAVAAATMVGAVAPATAADATAATAAASPTAALHPAIDVGLSTDDVDRAQLAPAVARRTVTEARETLKRIEPKPVQSPLVSVDASVAVEKAQLDMWIEVHTRYRAPVVGEGRWGMGSSVPCGVQADSMQRKACREAEDAVRALPD